MCYVWKQFVDWLFSHCWNSRLYKMIVEKSKPLKLNVTFTKYFQKQKIKKPFKLFLQKKIIFHLRLEMLFNILDGTWGVASTRQLCPGSVKIFD